MSDSTLMKELADIKLSIGTVNTTIVSTTMEMQSLTAPIETFKFDDPEDLVNFLDTLAGNEMEMTDPEGRDRERASEKLDALQAKDWEERLGW
ncbi:hypothetical protein NDU88_003541 [Pleurodeles waltl]|uniref:Uncharacterized protein n=1 Tax=Pleurodeles waltl TaxID=8319 RepID=A0AAV7T6Y7_PLEWA|nr:hypothetical protein NDU88_003541 [Pleurodeles waltl]